MKSGEFPQPMTELPELEQRYGPVLADLIRLRNIERIARWLSERYLANTGNDGLFPNDHEFVKCVTPRSGGEHHRAWKYLHLLTHGRQAMEIVLCSIPRVATNDKGNTQERIRAGKVARLLKGKVVEYSDRFNIVAKGK